MADSTDGVAGDHLYLIAEELARDSSLSPDSGQEFDPPLRGVLSETRILREAEQLDHLDIDSYIEAVISGAQDPGRLPAPEAIRHLGRLEKEDRDGPFYSAVVAMDFNGHERHIGFIAQNRAERSGEWMPEHHLKAAACIEEYSNRSLPIVSLMDTMGAAGDEIANKNNQSHSISRLIAEMSNADVPNLGIVYGFGYSGGAIPLAASNLILSVRDGVFSTIAPKGLASIARRLNLSWQQCAKQVGLSPYELKGQGNIDAVIDYVPGEDIGNLRLAIVSGLHHVEESTKRFVADHPYIMEHYRRSLQRYLNPSERLRKVQATAALTLTRNPTEYLNVFGLAYRYLRYLRVRHRIKSASTRSYGRLAEQELPAGELDARTDRERRETFLRWLQDPDKVIYDDALSRAWKNYLEKKQTVNDTRGRVAQYLFGERQKNYQDAKDNLIAIVGMYLYNRWKADAAGNFQAFKAFAENVDETRSLFRVAEFAEPRAVIEALRGDVEFGPMLRQRFTHEGMKLFANNADKSDAFLREQLAAEFNLAITEGTLIAGLAGAAVAGVESGGTVSTIVANRRFIDNRLGAALSAAADGGEPAPAELTVVDVVLREDLRADFALECENVLLFDRVYDHVVDNLDSIAQEAESTRELSMDSLQRLIETTLTNAAQDEAVSGDIKNVMARLRTQFFDWYARTSKIPRSSRFFDDVAEWKKNSFGHVSDTLFVVVTILFEKLLASYLLAQWEGRRYDGGIAPRRIGRRKDFWNRLTQAYRDLLIRDVLQRSKRAGVTSYGAFVERFFDDFEEYNGDLIGSDPRRFPGMRLAIENALQKNTPPCGVITGVGRFKNGADGLLVGTVISNIDFKAGAFDMASAEKFCKLLVVCAERRLPVICFISSGGMQTMEGAGALFSMAAINDRLTRFVRDFDLPVIIFGFGDCTGGAQASFVTHPLVQTCYFSGASIPFAGQIVVSSYLPSDAHVANYLSNVPGAMQGFVKHPMLPNLDDELLKIDPEIPTPRETVEEVVNRVMAGVLTEERQAAVAPRPSADARQLFRPVRKMLVHARGCTAVRLIRAAHEQDVAVVLPQSDPDMESVPVDLLGEADTLICIGGNTPDESYLNARSVVRIAEHEGVDSLHPGIGFLSENAQFAELVRAHGINFIGPPVVSMETMGNKSNAIATALANGVPVVPGSHGILTDGDRAAEVAAEIGYPVLIKAVHGGGGKGIKAVLTASDFHEAFHRVSMEARAAFGNGDVYLERFVTSLRHIEVQILRDHRGNVKILGLRDCSVQRDKQKVLEESGSTMLPGALERAVRKYAATLANAADYVGAGTVEFIYDLDAGAVYFMEMNTRLQVEHPVTEQVTGIDIVAQQLRIAAGRSIGRLAVRKRGYAIEARINAERLIETADGTLAFQPSPGEIQECVFPEENGIEVIACIAEGKSVSPYYDSMVAQIIARGANRATAVRKLAGYLHRVRIHGIATNLALLQCILNDKVFLGGDYDTGYLPELLTRLDAEALIADAADSGASVIGATAVAIDGSDELRVLAPSAGIFYSTPSPTKAPYAAVGDRVEVSATLCQLEAFKIFTPVRLQDFNTAGQSPLYDPERRFEVTRVNVASEAQVNAGDLLFVVRPVAGD